MPKLSNKEKALSSLLATNSVREAAADCGLSEETLYRFLKEPEFKSEYRETRRQMVETSIARIQQASGEAIDTLKRNLTCGNHSVEVRAAAIVLENSLKGVELTDILERLEALENEHQQQT